MRRVFHRRRPEGGAVAVEAALVLPLLLIMILGIVEMSLFMRDVVAVSSAVRVGSRIASVSAGAGQGTCQASANPPPCSPTSVPAFAQSAADAIARAGTAIPTSEINSVTIYEANTDGYPLPAGNKTLVCSTHCVVYVWDAGLNGGQGQFRYSSGTWPSTSVNACVNDPAETSVGVAMSARHPFLTHLFGSGATITEHSDVLFEPLPNLSCNGLGTGRGGHG